MKKKRSFAIRLGPLGLSLLAAGITAVAFAAVSLADSGSSGNDNGSGNGPETLQLPAPGGKGAAVIGIQGPNLSAADRQKMEEFRQCMQDNGAPAPPDPSDFDPGKPSEFDPSKAPPKLPSEADQAKLKQAFEACQDKLPRDVQRAGPPGIATCARPPGAPAPDGKEQGQQQNQDQSNSSGTSSSGSSS
jgi:hypothetical protein